MTQGQTISLGGADVTMSGRRLRISHAGVGQAAASAPNAVALAYFEA